MTTPSNPASIGETMGVRFSEPTRGPCLNCGAETEQFAGKSYCDPCVAEREEAQRAYAAETRLLDLVSAGYLRCSTGQVRFSRARPAGPNAEAWRRARQTTDNLWLWGPPGVGKSYLCQCILTDYVLRGGVCAAETSVRSVVNIAPWATQDLQRWMLPGLLLLDDVDKVAWTEATLAMFWELLDNRCAARRRTLVTANMKPSDFAQTLKERIPQNRSLADSTLDRLKPVQSLEFTGRSMR